MYESPGFLLFMGLFAFAVILIIVDRYYGARMRSLTNMDCCSRLDALQLVSTEQQKQISFLVAALQKSGVIQNDLELQLRDAISRGSQRANLPVSLTGPVLLKPLLLICGADEIMCNNDRQALRRAGVTFHRLNLATKQLISDELRRRRQDNTLYSWVHVTAHAGPQGILLEDGIADPLWWGQNFDGVDVIFFAACKTSNVADQLAGLMHVVFMQADVDERDAADFTYAFWSAMVDKNNPADAYRTAVKMVPAVSEFVDYRRN